MWKQNVHAQFQTVEQIHISNSQKYKRETLNCQMAGRQWEERERERKMDNEEAVGDDERKRKKAKQVIMLILWMNEWMLGGTDQHVEDDVTKPKWNELYASAKVQLCNART